MIKKEKQLYIISGANGSGKSTLAELLLKNKKLEFLNADDIAKELAPNAINKVPISAGKIYFKKLDEYFNSGISFAAESTLSGRNVIKIIERAKQKNYKIILIYIFLQSCASCIERIKTRVKNGGHNVPDEDVIRRYYKSIVKFWSEYKNRADEWTLFYNGFDYTPVIVSFGKNDNFSIINKELYYKFENILKIAEDKRK